jgi:hypothetical protein
MITGSLAILVPFARFERIAVGQPPAQASPNVTLLDSISYVEPDLQAEDGTYFGIVNYMEDYNDYLARFDESGRFQWTVPNY